MSKRDIFIKRATPIVLDVMNSVSKEMYIQDIIFNTVKELDLSEEEYNKEFTSGKRIYDNWITWTVQCLKVMKYVESAGRRGYWQLTEKGRTQQPIANMDEYMKKNGEAWKAISKAKHESHQGINPVVTNQEQTVALISELEVLKALQTLKAYLMQ